MPARPHDADEPGREAPDADGPGADVPRSEPGSEPVTDEPGTEPGTEPGPDQSDAGGAALDPAEVAARWAEIVHELGPPDDPRAWAPDPAVEAAEDHFQPPDPGPVLGGDPLLTMAWVAVVGVPLLLMVAVIAWRDMPTVVLRAAGVAFLVGVGLLIWRMPRDREDDSGPGAVV